MSGMSLSLFLELTSSERRSLLGINSTEVRSGDKTSITSRVVDSYWLRSLSLRRIESRAVKASGAGGLCKLLLRLSKLAGRSPIVFRGFGSGEILGLNGVAELGVRDLGIGVDVDSPYQRHKFVLQRVVTVLLEEDSQVFDVHFTFVLRVNRLETAKSREVVSLLQVDAQLFRCSQQLNFSALSVNLTLESAQRVLSQSGREGRPGDPLCGSPFE
jgi:hypothetical protein